MNFKPLIAAFIGKEYVLTTNVLFIKYMGSHEGGLFLQQLIYWQNLKGEGVMFPKSYDDWYNELVITKRVLSGLKAKLEAKNMLKTMVKKLNGTPTLHWCIDLNLAYNDLANFISESANGTMDSDQMLLSESDQMSLSIPYIENNKENINIASESTKSKNKQRAKYEIQNDHKTPEKLADLTRWSIENAVQQVRQLYSAVTGKQLSEADAQRWLELSAVGKHIDVSKCEFTSSGDVIETNLRQWLLNSAKYALQNGKFTLPAPQRTNAPAQNRTSVFD
jgi:hypothetical protein